MKEGGGGRRALNIAEVARRLAELPAEELKAGILHPNPDPNPNPKLP